MENEQVTKMTPKDFFLYIGAMATLYVSVFSLIALLFQYIETIFPDQLSYYHDPYSTAIRLQLASLIVIFPVYLFITRLLNRELRVMPEKNNLGIRKWLIYITLFIAGIAVLGDIIVLLNTFLGGELTTRFVLKILVVLVVVGSAFLYYFYDLKGKWEREQGLARIIAGVVSLFVLASIVAGFFIMGSPVKQRLLRFDQEKINNLQNIQWQVVNLWQVKRVLPKSLAELEDPISGFVVPMDSQTGESYTYRVAGNLSFELCAVFNEKSVGVRFTSEPPRPIPASVMPEKIYSLENSTWEHGVGETCFSRTIDPERYPKSVR